MTVQDPALETLRTRLEAIAPDGKFALAFSGGFDSRFLAFCALHFGFSPRLLIARGSQVPRKEIEVALESATALNILPECVEFEACRIENLAQAGKQRCYICKKAMFSLLLERCHGLALCDGTNASDLTRFRPGKKALEELGVLSPLAESGITKQEARKIASTLGMPHADQASSPCLLTRFPYGTVPSAQQLQVLGEAEAFVESVLCDDIEGLRLRFPTVGHPVLHIKLKNGSALPAEDQLRLITQMQTRFAPSLANLTISEVGTLSGFFDRTGQ